MKAKILEGKVRWFGHMKRKTKSRIIRRMNQDKRIRGRPRKI